MNATLKVKLLVPVVALVLGAAATLARAADDVAGMDHSKMGGTMEKDKKPAKESAKESSKKGEKLQIAITDKGFEPEKLEVKKGQPVELVFTRKTDQTCIKEVVLDTGSSKIQKPLPLNKPVTIKTKFMMAGDLKYACNMNMFSGTVTVQ
jgi:plastocyanin domain-containing protein